MKDNKLASEKRFNFIIGIAIFLVFLFISGHYNMVYTGERLFFTLKKAIPNMLNNPLNLALPTIEQVGIGFLISMVWVLVMYSKTLQKSKFRDGVEKGSAKWNKDISGYNKTYTSPEGKPHNKGEDNMILTDDIFLSMNTRQTMRNNNILIAGGSGSGKSRFIVKPNLLQANSSFVITDPSGELLASTGKFLESKGYEIRVFNLVNMEKSNTYNPFHYIRNEEGVMSMVKAFMKNTKDVKGGGDGDFWEDSMSALLQAISYYLYYEVPKADQNFSRVIELINLATLDSEDDTTPTVLDIMMNDLEEKDKEHIAVKQYKIFKQAPGKTAMSILVSAAVRLQAFNIKAVKELTSNNDIDLATVGDKKVALFCITPVVDQTFNFLVAMMYNQLFETLYYHAENDFEDLKLPVHVRFMLDEFANIGTIPDFEQKLATMRKYEISCTVILQNMAQLKTLYKDSWESITGNCDTFIFLGGQEQTTLELVSKKLGKETISIKGTSTTKGKKGSHSESINIADRDLMTSDEIARMPNTHCIAFIRGLFPFYSKKYDYPRHPNYKYTSDSSSKNTFKIDKIFKDKIVEEKTIEKKVRTVPIKKNELPIKRSSLKEIEEKEHFKEKDFKDMLDENNIDTLEAFDEMIDIEEAYSPDFEFEFE